MHQMDERYNISNEVLCGYFLFVSICACLLTSVTNDPSGDCPACLFTLDDTNSCFFQIYSQPVRMIPLHVPATIQHHRPSCLTAPPSFMLTQLPEISVQSKCWIIHVMATRAARHLRLLDLLSSSQEAILDIKRIRVSYLRTWFIPDVIAAFPIGYILLFAVIMSRLLRQRPVSCRVKCYTWFTDYFSWGTSNVITCISPFSRICSTTTTTTPPRPTRWWGYWCSCGSSAWSDWLECPDWSDSSMKWRKWVQTQVRLQNLAFEIQSSFLAHTEPSLDSAQKRHLTLCKTGADTVLHTAAIQMLLVI